MHKLDRTKYSLVSIPLSEVPFNTLFARSVADGAVNGDILVDNTEDPRTFLIRHPYGMSLLLGNSSNDRFNAWFSDYALNTGRTRKVPEWLQVHPDQWNPVIAELISDKLIRPADNRISAPSGFIEQNTRINFRFNRTKFESLKTGIYPHDHTILRTDARIFNELSDGVVPCHFWKDADDFTANGIGFTLVSNGKPASTAFASFICGNQLEIGIQTAEEFRRMGFSRFAGAAIIDYCIDNGYEPVWACRLENTGSYKLAQKLGFEVERELPYYRLSI